MCCFFAAYLTVVVLKFYDPSPPYSFFFCILQVLKPLPYWFLSSISALSLTLSFVVHLGVLPFLYSLKDIKLFFSNFTLLQPPFFVSQCMCQSHPFIRSFDLKTIVSFLSFFYRDATPFIRFFFTLVDFPCRLPRSLSPTPARKYFSSVSFPT